ncbi:MAG: threonine--tRNA ligase [Parachlamydiales bacterium]|jgi:threonyl-tRNA synthetase
MHIKLADKMIEVDNGFNIKQLAEKLNLNAPQQAVSASLNGKQCDLSTPLKENDVVEFLHFDDALGKEVFWHTSAHVLAQAVLRLFPEAKPTIGPPIEAGFYYDFANLQITDEDFSKIEEEVQKIINENYVSKKEVFKDKSEAKKHFASNKYKLELIDAVEEGKELTGYHQGEFFDLCRGPHLYNIGKIKAFKILKTSGAYWRGDSNNEMLTRIYAISFPDKKLLKEYLTFLEEAKKRDHKVIGPQLDLFSLKEEAPGMPFIHPKGMFIWNTLSSYIRELQTRNGYVEIKTPTMMTRELWETSGHWANYRQNMFTSQVEDRDFAIKPMNCPGGMLFYRSHIHSYRELPLRVAEIGNVHRFEPSGALSGLFRVRSFHQDDAHIFMKPEDIQNEILAAIRFADTIYSAFGLEYHLELSTRPEKNTIGSDEEWETATKGLQGALDASGRPYKINPGDGAFYGPKIDFHIRDALKRTWQCGTIQLDMSLPEKFELEYTASDGTRKRPVMIHRALLGSIERFFGILIEHFAGKFPLWISPEQVRVLTVADRHAEYGAELMRKFVDAGYNCRLDDSNESVSKKVRTAQMEKVNYILTVGDKETESKTVNLRTRDNVVHGEISVDELIAKMNQEKASRSLTSAFATEQILS